MESLRLTGPGTRNETVTAFKLNFKFRSTVNSGYYALELPGPPAVAVPGLKCTAPAGDISDPLCWSGPSRGPFAVAVCINGQMTVGMMLDRSSVVHQ